MNEEEYTKCIHSHKDLELCLIDCAQEISQISNGRDLIGEFTGDLEKWDDDKYFVQFESDCCGEPDYDSVFVPVKYIYDEIYREYYKRVLIHRKERDAEVVAEREEQQKARTYRIIVDERAEYERLKAKFGE